MTNAFSASCRSIPGAVAALALVCLLAPGNARADDAKDLLKAMSDYMATQQKFSFAYQSTIEALDALYPKLAPGGYCIVDDFGAIPACRQAVEDYRARHAITEPLLPVDWTCVYWRRDPA